MAKSRDADGASSPIANCDSPPLAARESPLRDRAAALFPLDPFRRRRSAAMLPSAGGDGDPTSTGRGHPMPIAWSMVRRLILVLAALFVPAALIGAVA